MSKNIFPKIFIVLVLIIAAYAAVFYVMNRGGDEVKPDSQNEYVPGGSDTIKQSKALINVPFTSQAPLADWKDPRHQDGCEEASILMAWLWLNNQTMTKEQAEKAIEDMSDYELATYGNFHDTDAYDTVKLMKDYYGYAKAEVKINPSIEDIKNQIRAGKIVIVPANGQNLDNPNYTAPGPYTHMLVIKGFDDDRDRFITNDPGTRLGEGFEFTYNNLYDAMVNYPTGQHLSQAGRPKAMIVITK